MQGGSGESGYIIRASAPLLSCPLGGRRQEMTAREVLGFLPKQHFVSQATCCPQLFSSPIPARWPPPSCPISSLHMISPLVSQLLAAFHIPVPLQNPGILASS